MSSDSNRNAVLEKIMLVKRPLGFFGGVWGLGALGVVSGLGLGGFLLSDADRVSNLRRRVIQSIEQTTASQLTAIGALEPCHQRAARQRPLQ